MLALASAFLVVAPAEAAPPKVRHAERLLETMTGVARFSPNGDGSVDRSGFQYRLEQRARVKVAVRNARGEVVRSANLGKRSAGGHHWTWNGRNRSGAYVRDGAYRVTFTAPATRGKPLRDSDTSRAVTRRTFDRSPNGYGFTPGLIVDRDAIYRDTTYFKDEFLWYAAYYTTMDGGYSGNWGASRITARNGDVVYERGERYESDGDQGDTWDGTDEDGVRVPAGTYTLINTWADLYGNHLSVTKPLVVRDGSRVEQHHSVTVTPAEARVGTATEPFEFLAGGHRTPTYLTYACPPRSSDRFPAGALSFALYDPRCTVSNDTFKVASPVDLDLTFDTVTLTAVGGPTAAGGEGSASLSLTLPSSQPTLTGAGDEATTVSQTTRGPFQPPVKNDVTWGVSRVSGGYDFKSFTVDIYHYEPPA